MLIPATATDASQAAMPVREVRLHVLVDLDRSWDRDALIAAMEGTIRTWPVLACRYQPQALRDVWVSHPGVRTADLIEHLDVDPGDVEDRTLEYQRRSWSTQDGWPWRVLFLRHKGGARLVLTVAHDVADGAGTLAILRELARRLALPKGGDEPDVRGRGMGQIVRAIRPRHVRGILRSLLREMTLPFRWFGLSRLFPVEGPPLGESPVAYRLVFAKIPDDRRYTVNDRLIAALGRTAVALSPSGDVALVFTADLRRILPDRRPSVANLSSIISLVLPREALGSAEDALEAVHRHVLLEKKGQAGLGFFVGATVWGLVMPHALVRLIFSLYSRWATILLSRALLVTNLGPMDEALSPFGKSALRAWICGPCMSISPAPLVTVTGFRGRLTLCLNGYTEQSSTLDRVGQALETAVRESGVALD